LAALVLSGLGAGVGESMSGSASSTTSELLGEVGLWAGMLGTAVFVSRRYGESLRQDYGLALKGRDLAWGAAALAAGLAAALVVATAFAGTKFAGSDVQILTQHKGHEAGLVAVSLMVVVGAPFFEELFFRGFLRTALRARFGAHGAVWLQAVLFGLAHCGEAGTTWGNVSVVVAMVAVGVVLGYTAEVTGRLGAGMVAHCLFNLIPVISLF
jgi:hypothetical protein